MQRAAGWNAAGSNTQLPSEIMYLLRQIRMYIRV